MAQADRPAAPKADEPVAGLAANGYNPGVDQIPVSHSNTMVVWYAHVGPGERAGFHRCVADSFWHCFTHDCTQSRTNGERPIEPDYATGSTGHMAFDEGEFMLHDVENSLDSNLAFITAELLQGADDSLRLPSDIQATGIIPDRALFE